MCNIQWFQISVIWQYMSPFDPSFASLTSTDKFNFIMSDSNHCYMVTKFANQFSLCINQLFIIIIIIIIIILISLCYLLCMVHLWTLWLANTIHIFCASPAFYIMVWYTRGQSIHFWIFCMLLVADISPICVFYFLC